MFFFENFNLGNHTSVVFRIKKFKRTSLFFLFFFNCFPVFLQESIEPFHNEKAENYNCCYCDNNNNIFHKVTFF